MDYEIQSLEEIQDGECSKHFYPLLVKVFGSFPIGILLSHLINKMSWEDSVVLVNTEEFLELGFTKREFDTSRGKLRDYGIITFKKGGKTETAYTIDFGKLCSYINGQSEIKQDQKANEIGKAIGQLKAAFKNAGLNEPNFVGGSSYARALLTAYTPDEVALCWKDIYNSKFGSNLKMKDFLSFGYLARNNIIDKWKEWKKNGRTNHVRPGERAGDTAQFAGKTGSWEKL